MVEDLARWLGEQLDADERIARAADADLSNLTGCVEIEYPEIAADEAHALRHSPARVLRDIDAKRKLLREYELADREAKYPDFMGGYSTGLDYAVQLVAATYADRPGYDPEWAPRSQWGPSGAE